MGVRILCLNVLRTFKDKKLQLLAIIMIIFLSSFIYSTMFYTLGSLAQSMEKVIQTTNQEDFSIEMVNGIVTNELEYLRDSDQMAYMGYSLSNLKKASLTAYKSIIGKRIKSFQKKYPRYELEIREFKDVDFDDIGKGHTIRFYKDAEVINTTYIEAGRKPQTRSEVALTRVYAEKNKLNLGDSIKIKGKEYKLVGLVTFPDMTFPMMGTDLIIDTSKISTGLVIDKEYEHLKGKESIYLAGKAVNKEELNQFKEKVIDDIKNHESLEFITDIVLTKNQMRSGAIYEELKAAKAMTLGLSMIISSLAVMIVAILVARILKNERVQIGVLKALGYSRTEITLPYIGLLLLIAFPSLLAGYIGGIIAAGPLKNFYLDFYLLPTGPIDTSLEGTLTAIALPLIVIVGFSYCIIIKLLSKDAIKLLKIDNEEKVTRINKLVVKTLVKAKAQTKYKYSFIFKNLGKFAVFFWGISFSSILILLSLMMVGFFERMTVDAYTSKAYAYEGHLDMTKGKPRIKTGQEKFLAVPYSFYNEEVVSSIGLNPDNKLYKLYNRRGEDLTERLREGIIINKSFQVAYDAKVGQQISIEINDDIYIKTIVGICKDYGEPTIYWSREELSKAVTQNKSKEFYTGIYSQEPLDEKEYAVVVSKESIIEQAALMQGFIKISIYGMIISAAYISILILYVLTSLTVEDNYYNISLLKVMGYSKREVNNMILNSYLVYGVITYLLILPLSVLGIEGLVRYFSKAFGVVMPLQFQGWHSIVGLILIIGIFSIGSYGAKRKIEKVPLQEILKAYRE